MSTAVVTQSIQESANKAGKAPKRISLPTLHHYRHHCHQKISGTPFSPHHRHTHHKRLTCIPTVYRNPLPKVVTMVTAVTARGLCRTSAAGVTDLKAAPSLPRLVWSLLWPARRRR